MKRIDPSIFVGLVLILLGGLFLLQNMGILDSASDIFWGLAFLAGGALFMVSYFSGSWWAAIPGLTLLGIGGLILLPAPFDQFGGALFLGALALAFWLVYLSARGERWWALIPAGVLTTIALIAVPPDMLNEEIRGGMFMLGLGLTFLLVALLAKMRWAFYPSAALGVIGILLMISVGGFVNYIWAAALIVAGAYLIYRTFKPA